MLAAMMAMKTHSSGDREGEGDVKSLVTVIVGYRDKASISENLGLIDAQPLGDLAGVLLGLSIVFAYMTHPVMCRRTADQVKEISGHAGSTATGDACSNGSGSSEVSVRSFDRG
jgi:hypothetical protein